MGGLAEAAFLLCLACSSRHLNGYNACWHRNDAISNDHQDCWQASSLREFCGDMSPYLTVVMVRIAQ